MGDRGRGVRHPPMTAGELAVWAATFGAAYVDQYELVRAHPGRHTGGGSEAVYAAEIASEAVEQLRAALPQLAEIHGAESEQVAQALLVLGQWHPGRKVVAGG